MKHSGMKRILALALAAAMCFSVLSVGAMASEEMPAVSLMEELVLLPEEVLSEEEPVTDAAAEEPAPEEIPAEEEAPGEEIPGEDTPAEEPVRRYWINPLSAGRISPEDLPGSDSISLDGAAPGFSTAKAAGAYVREQMIARSEEISFVYSGDFDAVLNEALVHTGEPKAGDSIVNQLAYWDGAIYSDGTMVLYVQYYTTAAQEAAVDNKVVQLKTSLNLPRASDYETVKAVHDYLCENVVYDWDYETATDDTPWTTWGALVKGECVCQGYSLAMYRLMLECGIDCRIIGGVDHAWNIVELDGLYYSLDVTWADQEEYGIYYDWFLKGKGGLSGDHKPTTDVFGNDMSLGSSFWNDYPMSLTDYDPDNPGSGSGGGGTEEEPEGIPVDDKTFQDWNFFRYVRDWVDLDGNGWLSETEIAAVTELNLRGYEIGKLEGLQYFTELGKLDCADNSITELDVSALTNLWYLDVSGNGMETLTLGEQENLYYLYCENNELDELDITGCPELQYLWCYNNRLEALDVSECQSLVELNAFYNSIDSLDVSGLSYLEYLDVSDNGMESLTLGENESLLTIYCEYNALEELDVTGCPALQCLWCYENNLAELDVSGCPDLLSLGCFGNGNMEYLDVSGCPVLAALVETVYPQYFYEDGYVEYGYYLEEEELMLDVATDIGMMIYTRELLGDMNGDGYIDRADAMLVLMHTVGTGALTGEAAHQADVNLNGVIDARDAVQILRYMNGLASLIRRTAP